MPSINNVTLMGRMVRDADIRQTSTGKQVASFALAVGGDDAIFVDITAWDQQAEWAGKASKGALVAVEGRLTQDKWEDKQSGQKRSKLLVTAFRVHFCRDAYREGAPETADDAQRDTERAGAARDDATPETDEIPF